MGDPYEDLFEDDGAAAADPYADIFGESGPVGRRGAAGFEGRDPLLERDVTHGAPIVGRVTQLGTTTIEGDPRGRGRGETRYDPSGEADVFLAGEADEAPVPADVSGFVRRYPVRAESADRPGELGRLLAPELQGSPRDDGTLGRRYRLAQQAQAPGSREIIAQYEAIPEVERVSPREARIRGVADMATLGHTDELAGAIDDLTGGDYERGRDALRQRGREIQEQQGDEYSAGQLVGGAALAALPGAGSLAAARGLGAAGRVGLAVTEGVGMGAAAGEGFSEREGEALLHDTAAGAALGGLASGAVSGAAQGARRAGQALLDNPEVQRNLLRLRALFGGERPPRRLFREIAGERRGRPERLAARMDELEAIRGPRGERLRSYEDAPRLLEGIDDELHGAAEQLDEVAAARAAQRPVNAPSPDELAENVGAAAAPAAPGPRLPRGVAGSPASPADEVAVEAMQGATGPAGMAGAGYRAGSQQHAVDPHRIAQRIRERAAELQRDRGVPQTVVDAMEAEAQRWEQAASEPMTFSRAWRFRQQMGRPEYWTVGPRGELSPAAAHRRELYSIVRDEMLRGAEALDPAQAQRFRTASQQASALIPFAQAADEAMLRGAQNRQVSLSDTIAAAGALGAGGGIVSAGLAAGANRAVRRFEHRARATALGAAQGIQRIVQRVQRIRGGPELGRYGDALDMYGRALADAARRGPGTVAAMHYVLSQRDPEYRQLVERASGDENDDAALYGAEGEQ